MVKPISMISFELENATWLDKLAEELEQLSEKSQEDDIDEKADHEYDSDVDFNLSEE